MTDNELDEFIYRSLCDAAKERAACPSNRSMAIAAGTTEYAIRRGISRLEKAGIIRVTSVPEAAMRKVTLVFPGLDTDWSRAANPNLVPPADDAANSSWPHNCFAAHNIETDDDKGTFSLPETYVPTMGVLA